LVDVERGHGYFDMAGFALGVEDELGVMTQVATPGGLKSPDPRPSAPGGRRPVRHDDERLADILKAAEKITIRAAKGRAAFDADEDTQIVLVHLIQVIGEAASGLSDGFIAQHPKCPGARSSPPATASCTAT
jgi:hypothetical protein